MDKTYSYMCLANIVLIASGLISILPDNTQLPLAVAFIFCGMGIVIMARFAAGAKA